MTVNGKCHCGYLRYEAEVDPMAVHICHCLDCQSLSGSAFRVVVPAIDGTLKVVTGTPTI